MRLHLFWFSLLVGASFLVTSASCGQPTRCSASTCTTGCCDISGRCVMGNTSSQCGARGVSCTSCSLGQTCDLGACVGSFGTGAGTSGTGGGVATGGGFSTGGGVATGGGIATGGGMATGGGFATGGGAAGCNSQTCANGCCDFNGQCQSGTSNTACGSVPTTCVQCGLGQTCSARRCVSGTGGGGAGGGSPPACTNGCVFNGIACLTAGTTQQNNSLCGNAGAVCFACSTPNNTCMNGFCIPGGAGGGAPPVGGGSPTGGGSGTGGGTSACPPLSLGTTTFPGGGFTTLEAGYDTFSGGEFNVATFATGTQVLSFELVRLMGSTVPVPYSGSFMPVGYNTCVGCLQFGESCSVTPSPPDFTCARRFLAQSGTVNISAATPSAISGSFSGTVSNVTFREWNFGPSDSMVPGGACYTLGAASFNASWP
ncbi:MAG: hypothetical protein Q8S33_24295 [Myxococcales bacterium]|nr:hypothetical protein [Myxococcales bacterium]